MWWHRTLILINAFVVLVLPSGGIAAQTRDPLQRAIAAIGGVAALDRARSISVVMIGTQDRLASSQGYYATRPSPNRIQETLIIDEPTQRAALRRETTIITTPNNYTLAKAITRKSGISSPNIQLVKNKMSLGSGEERIDIWTMTNEQHAESMLFIHLPGRRIIFEGDLSDYIPSLWNFLRFVDWQQLKVDRVFSVHSSTPHSLKELQGEDPEN